MQALTTIAIVAFCAAAVSALSLRKPGHSGEESEALRTGVHSGDKNTYTLPQDAGRVNPNRTDSDWTFLATSANNESVANDGTILENEDADAIDLVSLPFRMWNATDDKRVVAIADNNELMLVHKENYTVDAGKMLTVHVKFTCKTFNTELHPLAVNGQSISKPDDDPTLGSCEVGILSNDEAALGVSIVATNKGVWMMYERNRNELLAHPERHQREFTVFKRLADRTSVDEPVDATIVYDRSEGKIHLKVNGEEKFVLGDLGTLNDIIKDQPAYNEVYTKDREDLKHAEPQEISVVLGLMQRADTIDPNNPSNPPLYTSRLTTDPNYYDPKAKFEDEENKKDNNLWGEGASMGLQSIKIKQ